MLNIMELALLRPIEDCPDCDIVLLRGLETGAVEDFTFVSSFMLDTLCSVFPFTRDLDAVTLVQPLETGHWPLDSRGLSLVTAAPGSHQLWG